MAFLDEYFAQEEKQGDVVSDLGESIIKVIVESPPSNADYATTPMSGAPLTHCPG